MNTNETIKYKIPTGGELDVSVQGAERRGYRAGVEAMRLASVGAVIHWFAEHKEYTGSKLDGFGLQISIRREAE